MTIKAFNERKEFDSKQLASNVYILADLIGASVSRLFSKNNKMPDIKKVYPTLFDNKENEPEDWRIMKEKLLTFADHRNKKYKGGGENN